jgi:hypothetical protein
VFSRLADGRADFLAERIVSGPYPAVRGLETQWVEDEETGHAPSDDHRRRSDLGRSESRCLPAQHRTVRPLAFLQESQHDVSARKEGLALKFETGDNGNLVDLTDDDVKELVKMGRVFGGWTLAPGGSRSRSTLSTAAASCSRSTSISASARSSAARAKALIELCKKWGIVQLPIWGDAANPQDIMEINSRSGSWAPSSASLRSPWRTRSGARRSSASTSCWSQRAFLVRRTIGNHLVWLEGFNAGSAGHRDGRLAPPLGDREVGVSDSAGRKGAGSGSGRPHG